ncbi:MULTISPECIES: phage Gp37/Gp68 family protein [unclassified Chelatococcus]|uniref:phage Gp37/Gp68 family protein n=1 Tax=unclassified Chelatococcus TaxID=2638111 RepID=UPI001BCD59D4|nr:MULTISPECIES: phage Gp37/Gp68 family protein [unclassified Chelatococcus]MBS7699200.1 phage Gp37/Gp68 family protein [Chelatococcus sp. YT9]MBX3554981.1 phage Gp37/Gp68 family protein [Chelatococcus sp.]
MGDRTGIQWTDATWNPIVGCSIVSPGCTNCYAMKMSDRIEKMTPGSHYAGTTMRVKGKPVWTSKMAMAPDAILTQPLRWKRPRRVFVNSMGDLFHESVPDDWIDRVFAVMALAPQHSFQVLTKRSARMRDYLCTRAGDWVLELSRAVREASLVKWADRPDRATPRWPLPNVWLGVSAEDQRRWEERIPDLKATPATVRFVSAEPLLGPIVGDISGLDWIIVGGESGPGSRPMHPDWARSIRDQCAAAGVPFFFKQWGDWSVALDRSREDPDWSADYGYKLSRTRPDIAWLNLEGGSGFHGERFHVMRRIGKRSAGRLLDGIEHNAMPGGAHA